jgi:hypothetical protein
MSWKTKIVVAENEDAYYACLDASTHPDPDKTTTFERDYQPLEDQIAKLLTKEFNAPVASFSFFDDWCPNRTRHVTCESRFLNPRVVQRIHDLLQDEYQYWRIELIVVGSIEKDDRQGAIAVSEEWLLCEGAGRSLCPTQ